ncbi:MAG TPA: LCCL domain-containing protein [Steroidobacteraceae bacterium]|jgi:hypothetical protein
MWPLSTVAGRKRGYSSGALVFVLLVLAGLGHGSSRASGFALVDWHTSPLDLNLRGANGGRFHFRCPPGKPSAGQVVGSGPYTDGSSICAAAAHAGSIRAADGGAVTIELRPGQSHFIGSLSHYVQSESYDTFWSGSFIVITE